MRTTAKSSDKIGVIPSEGRGPFYLWQGPDKHVSVRLNLDVVDRLGLDIQEGFFSPAQRGVETGGLLLGRSKGSRGSIVVDVEDFEPIACEHAAGPSYFLSANDREVLENRLRRHKSAGGLSVVGFYRSHTRKDFDVSMEDVCLMEAYFAESSKVFLLIHAHRDGRPSAGFATWEGRGNLSLSPRLDFPFRRADLTAGGHEIQEQDSAPKLAPQRKVTTPARPTVSWKKQLPALAFPAWQLQMPSLKQVLKRVSKQAQTPLKFEWLAAAAAGAVGVFLLIALLVGVLSRSTPPVVASVPPRVSVPQETAEASRAVDDAAEPTIPAPEAALAAPGESTAIAQPTEAPPIKPPSEVPALTPGEPPVKAPEPRQAPVKNKKREYQALPSSPKPNIAPVLPELAMIAATPRMSALPEAPEIISRGSDTVTTRTREAADPFVRVAVDRLPDSNSGGLRNRLLGRRPKRTDFVPPAPVRQEPTAVPSAIRDRIKKEVPVDVKVYVDRTGKVEYAELLSKGTGPDRDLASLAVFAARRWRFEPAHLGDDAVPAEVVLHFRFGPSAR